ncbi:hypothetical protein I6F11_29640, partial [Ensifer sp. NBAIM29]|nr:hypothetical protein [Ensifer sp. NBAIM29]
MDNFNLPTKVLIDLYKAEGKLKGWDETQQLPPDPADTAMIEAWREIEKNDKTDVIVDELRKEFPEGSFDESKLRDEIERAYDEAIRQQDEEQLVDVPRLLSPDFEQQQLDGMRDRIAGGEFSPDPADPAPGDPGPGDPGPGDPGPGDPGPGDPSPGDPGPGDPDPGPGGEPGGPPGGRRPAWRKPGNPMDTPPASPLVLDLDGNGIEITELSSSTAFFDFDMDGFAQWTAWIGTSDGFLALDLNGNNGIDDLSELFGFESYNSPTDHGFTKLSAYDENGDQVIDAADSVFPNLRVWRDLDGDGVSDNGELFGMEELGITAINLQATFINTWQGENWLSHVSTFTSADGSTKNIYDVWFEHSDMYTVHRPSQQSDLDPAVKTLPNLAGYGNVRDLNYAMSADGDLRAQVTSLVLEAQQLSPFEIHTRFETILLKWTGANDVTPGSRGTLVDAQHLAVLEALHGRPFQNWVGGDEAGVNAARLLEDYYQEILASYLLKFLVQQPMSYFRTVDANAGQYTLPIVSFLNFEYDVSQDRVLGAQETFLTDLVEYTLKPAIHINGSGSEFALQLLGPLFDQLSVELFGTVNGLNGAISELLPTLGVSEGLSLAFAKLLAGANFVVSTASTAALTGTSGVDVLRGGVGDDLLEGGAGDDTYVYRHGDGDDTISEGIRGGAADSLVLIDANPTNVTLARNGNDVTVVVAESVPGAGDGGSILLKNNLDDYYDRGIDKIVFADGTTWTRNQLRLMLLQQAITAGDDTITGFNTADVIDAGAGNDTINAGDGDDTITGGHGDDVIDGGRGNDTYYYSRGDGNDILTEGSNGGSADTLILTGINPGDVMLARNGNDVTVVVAESVPGAGDGGSILLKNNLDDYYDRGIDKIVFADGTTWTRNQLRLMLLQQAITAGDGTITGFNTADVIDAGAGNDTINAGDGDDTITGGHGDDVIDGGRGNDTYYYSRGDGNDILTEGSNGGSADTLILTGINPGDVMLGRNGNDVTLAVAESVPGAGDGGSIVLKTNLDDYYDRGIDKIIFADGTVWTRATLRVRLVSFAGTEGDDSIAGSNVADVIDAGDGNDAISAGDGNDTITGGRGDDLIEGGKGDDTFYYSRGDGNDTIIEGTNGGVNDTFVFTDINPGDVTLVRNSNDLTIVIAESGPGAGDGGSILLNSNLDDYYNQGVDRIVFADGTIATRADARAYLLASAMSAGEDTIVGFNVADVIDAGDGDDAISAGDGNDTITGGRGDDLIEGGKGDDTYYYSRGDGNDTIIEGTNSGVNDTLMFTDINPGDVTLVRNGNDLTIVIAESGPGAGDGGSILLNSNLDDYYNQGVDRIVFADGTIATRADARAYLLASAMSAGEDTIVGFNVADVIDAGDGNDAISAGDGNDTITGGRGDDLIEGGKGDDTYYYSRGDGNDTIIEGTNSGVNDTLVFTDINRGEVRLVRNGNDLTIDMAESAPGAGDDGSVLIKATLDDYYSRGVEKIVLADGTSWTRADLRGILLSQASTTGDDTIVGFNVADTISGGRGNDMLTGGSGNDFFVFKADFGLDTVTDFKAGSGAGDVLEFDNTLFADFEAVLAAASQVGSDTVIAFDAANSVTLKNV